MPTKKIEQPSPLIPPKYVPADATAIQALAVGEAHKQQQLRALEWILHGASNYQDVEYRTNDRDHAFGSGRRFVGLQVVKLMSLNVAALLKKQE